MNETRGFLEDVRGYVKDDKPGNVIGTIDSGYTTGRPRVLFDGETVLGAKVYPFLASYAPRASDRVTLAPMGSSFVILGTIEPDVSAPSLTFTSASATGVQMITRRAGFVAVNFRALTSAAIAALNVLVTLPVGYRPDPAGSNYFLAGAYSGTTWTSIVFYINVSDGTIRPLTGSIPSGVVASGLVVFPVGG